MSCCHDHRDHKCHAPSNQPTTQKLSPPSPALLSRASNINIAVHSYPRHQGSDTICCFLRRPLVSAAAAAPKGPLVSAAAAAAPKGPLVSAAAAAPKGPLVSAAAAAPKAGQTSYSSTAADQMQWCRPSTTKRYKLGSQCLTAGKCKPSRKPEAAVVTAAVGRGLALFPAQNDTPPWQRPDYRRDSTQQQSTR